MSSPPLPDWRPRKTVLDMYEELDRIPWYLRVLATASAMMLLIGFLVLPLTWTQGAGAPFEPQTAFVGALITVGLALTISILLSLARRALLFHLNSLYLPHLTSSVLGLVNIAFYIPRHRTDILQGDFGHIVTAISLSSIMILLYTTLSIVSFRQTYIIRARDAMHRRSSSDRKAVIMPEVEAQRKQLLRLLSQQNEARPSNPGDITENTFKIDWPGSQLKSQRNSQSIPSLHTAVKHKPGRLSTSKGDTLAEYYAPADDRRTSTIGNQVIPPSADPMAASLNRRSSIFDEYKAQIPLPAYVEAVPSSVHWSSQSRWGHDRMFADRASSYANPTEQQRHVHGDYVATDGIAFESPKRLPRRCEIELNERGRAT